MASREITYQNVKYNISYEVLNNAAKAGDIVFLHGWGAKKELMKKAFAPFLKDHRLIFVDLPGFGGSSVSKALFTKDYAGIVRAFLADISTELFCVVGHSFGGKVASLLAPKHLVLLSSAGIKRPKSLSVRAKIRVFKLFKALGFGRFYGLFASKDAQGMSAIMYETFKNVVDEDFSEVFSSCESLALVFWGREDEATPLSSGEKLASLLPKCVEFRAFGGDHFFFLHHAAEICESINELICNKKDEK